MMSWVWMFWSAYALVDMPGKQERQVVDKRPCNYTARFTYWIVQTACSPSEALLQLLLPMRDKMQENCISLKSSPGDMS